MYPDATPLVAHVAGHARHERNSEPVCFPQTAQAPVLTSDETAAILTRVQELGGIDAMQHYRADANAKFRFIGFDVGLGGAWYDAEKGKPPQTIHHNIRLPVPTKADVFSKRLSTYNSQTTKTPMPARLLTFEQIAQAVGGAAGGGVETLAGVWTASGAAAVGAASGGGIAAAASATAVSGNVGGGAATMAAPFSLKWAPISTLGPTVVAPGAAPGAAHGAAPAAESTVRRHCVRTASKTK